MTIIYQFTYSGDLTYVLVWYSGHEHLSDRRMVHYSDHDLNNEHNRGSDI